MTANNALISPVFFQRVDSPKEHIVETVKLVAEHFKVQRTYIDKICWMIKTSVSWFKEGGTLNKELLSNWKKGFIGESTYSPEKEEIANIIENGFLQCEDYSEFNTLRGLMFEGIIIGVFGGKCILENYCYGWGAEVRIFQDGRSEVVDYQCKFQRTSNCYHRLTIDFGYWDKDENFGEFFECKVSPNNFTCKEDMYMKTLQDKIIAIEGNGKYYLAAPMNERSFKYTALYSEDVLPFGIDSIQKRYMVG